MRPPRPSISGEVALLALLMLSCSGNLHPIRGPLPGSDAAAAPDALIATCPDELVGYATVSDVGGEPDGSVDALPAEILSGGVTWSGPLTVGTPLVVDAADGDALTTFRTYASDKMPGPLTILVKGMISIPPVGDGGDSDSEKLRISSNKIVLGADGNSGFYGGGLWLSEVSNVIIRNLIIARPNADASSHQVDAIHVETSTQIWIDHCDVSSNLTSPTDPSGPSYDGLIDISDQSDFVTVSWTYYHDHVDSGIVGRSESTTAALDDYGREHVTYDHDFFANVATGPRVRFGTAHVLNTYFYNVAFYGVAAIDGANVRIENSSFDAVTAAGQTDTHYGYVTTLLSGSLGPGYAFLTGNAVTASGAPAITTQATDMRPPYQYTADSASSVEFLASMCARTGKVTVPPIN